MKDNWRPSKVQLRVREFARSKASKQLLRVPYDDFVRATRRYVRWEAFSLWVRAVLEFENEIHMVARDALKEHCPSFLKDEGPVTEPSMLTPRLDEWIRERFFTQPRHEGWFEAILFYGLRDPKLKYAYAYWEKCEREWTDARPCRYPAFETWFQSACNCDLFPVDAKRFSKFVESYLEWLSLAFWLEPILEDDVAIPSRLGEEMKQKGPAFREIAKRLESGERNSITTKFHLMSWVENRYFVEAREGNWLETVRGQVQNHPRYVRISEYSRRWREQRPQDRLRLYPSFASWCHAAEDFVETLRR